MKDLQGKRSEREREEQGDRERGGERPAVGIVFCAAVSAMSAPPAVYCQYVAIFYPIHMFPLGSACNWARGGRRRGRVQGRGQRLRAC